MGDDTPTQRFDGPDGDQPTRRMDAAATPGSGEDGVVAAHVPVANEAPTAQFGSPEAAASAPATGAAAGGGNDGDKRSRRLLIILGSIGGVLLLAVLILLFVLLNRDNGQPVTAPVDSPTPSVTPTVSETPSASPTPSPTPTETEEPPPPPPPPTGPQLASFTGTGQVLCNAQAPNPPEYVLSFSWQSSNVNAVYFGVATADASTGALFEGLPPTGNSADHFPYPIEFPCPEASQTYTLTVVGDNNQKVHSTITVVNNGDTQ